MLFPYKDDNPRILVPYVTFGLIGLNALIFFFQFGMELKDPEIAVNIIYTFGLIPAQFSILSLITSMFLHGGFAHIVGNMWFLWVFGDNVESTMGHVRFLVFYILCGLAAGIAQITINPDSIIPMVGASGAIAGVLGTYMMRFPHAKVHVFVFIVIFFTTIQVPAYLVLGIWFIIQLTSGLGSLGFDTTGGVAWFAHIGGFIAGIIIQHLFKIIKLRD
ncbi:MAG: rhomboid family intramembrane serine protease, partial [Candidatus Neomarinimicrobiota bacterium]